MSREKTNKLNIYRIRSEFNLEDVELSGYGYDLDFVNETQKFFVHRGNLKVPDWCEYFEGMIDQNNLPENISTSFVYLYKKSHRIYAVTGGYGFTKIDKFIEEDFGLELAIRMIKENKISALNQQPLKGATRQIFRAVNGYNPIFDRENYNRILKFIQGKGEFENRVFTISGRSSVSLRTTKSIAEIQGVFNEIEEVEQKTPNIALPKSYKRVKDETILSRLDDCLVSNFNEYWRGVQSRENFYLEFKDPISQFKCEKFEIVYKGNSKQIAEFDLDKIKTELISLGLSGIPSKETLEKIWFLGRDEADEIATPKLNMYDCLTAELQLGNDEFIKFGRQWFLIQQELKEYLNREILNIKVERGILPVWSTSTHREEKDYNRYFSDLKTFVFMDSEFVYFEGRQKLELCDVYDVENNAFYHIKKTWGAKSSYLFLQGSTSLEYFLQSPDFFSACQSKWRDVFDQKKPTGKIYFGIADNKANDGNFPLNLTYFAKLNLMKAFYDIKNLNYELALCPISLTS